VSDRSPLVVKVGGGLLQAEGLAGLRRACAEAVALAQRRPVLVVPGGGPFADAVRAVDAQVGLGDDLAHALALQAMDQLGAVLRPLLGDCAVTEELAPPPRLALLRAAPAFGARPEIPHSWTVTSDSLAVFAAAAVGAPEAVLLKPVSGAGVVDAYLAQAVRDTGVAVTVRRPGETGGTRITSG
jgi:5-(aminomethyl)-3-furanmethanol phosphate kinase